MPLVDPRHLDARVDFSLMDRAVPPIAGAGGETFGWVTGWSHCGYCGYTGRVKGPVQASCPERNGWHRWLEKCHDLSSVGAERETDG